MADIVVALITIASGLGAASALGLAARSHFWLLRHGSASDRGESGQ